MSSNSPASPTWSELGLPEAVVASLTSRGIESPFPIQTLAIPPALEGKDVCGRAPTGSGKTIAFGLPLAQRVARAKPKRPRALILAPTRELAEQIRGELKPLLAPHNRSVGAFYGGVGFQPQLKQLRRGVDVAVACPGRLADLVQRGHLRLDAVEIVVIDEADRMADMGFLPEVKRILDQVRPDRQTLLFSATLDGDVDVLIKRYQNDPQRCSVVPEKEYEDKTVHRFVDVRREERVKVAADIISQHYSTIVFTRTKHGADRVARQLRNEGATTVSIHGGRSQSQRRRALAQFSEGKAQAMVATDVAARGIHVDNVGCVVHFDVAGDYKDYVHRSGRTGRAGSEGVVVTLVTDADSSKVRPIQKALGVPLAKPSKSRPKRRKEAGQQRQRRNGQHKNRNRRTGKSSQAKQRGQQSSKSKQGPQAKQKKPSGV